MHNSTPGQDPATSVNWKRILEYVVYAIAGIAGFALGIYAALWVLAKLFGV